MARPFRLYQRIKPLVDQRGITPYRFWKDLGVAQNTAYSLYNDPTYIPREEVMSLLFQIYSWQPGDYLYVAKIDSILESTSASTPTHPVG